MNNFPQFAFVAVGIVFLMSGKVLRAQENEMHKYANEIQQWHELRVKNLQKEHGWLSLVALDWLQEGENEIENIGTFFLHREKIIATINSGQQATMNGKPFFHGELKTDSDSIGAEKIIIGTKAFVIIRRGERFAVRMWDSETQTRKNFSGIEMFPVAEQWKIEARWEEYTPKKKILIPTIIPGSEDEAEIPGVAIIEIGGKEHRLEPTVDGSEYFFVFADETNGKESYGAGRFLYTPQAKDGKVTLDFNKCYNPPCAFTPYATCPLPTKENRLRVRIEAGEKKMGEE